MSAPEISICIASWNTRILLRDCLQSLRATCDLPHEVIVVDNASRDGSAAMIRQEFPEARLLENDINRGFAVATNQALVKAAGRFVVLLNSDTYFCQDTLGGLWRFLEEHPRAGAAAPLQRRPNGCIQRSWGPLPSLGAEISRALLLDRLSHPPRNGTGHPWQVENLMGACLMLKRETINQAGLLDEGFFHYGEDVDLCWRLKKAGWKIYLLPWLEVIHYGAASSRQVRRQTWLNYHRSKCRLFRKHLGPTGVVAVKMLLTAEALAKGAAALYRPSPAGRRKVRDCAALLWRLRGF